MPAVPVNTKNGQARGSDSVLDKVNAAVVAVHADLKPCNAVDEANEGHLLEVVSSSAIAKLMLVDKHLRVDVDVPVIDMLHHDRKEVVRTKDIKEGCAQVNGVC